MRGLKILLGANGLVFLLRAIIDFLHPTSFYVPPEAPRHAKDAVHVIGIAYVTVGAAQLGACRSPDRVAIRSVSGASLLFATATAVKALTQGGGSDTFHRIRRWVAAENLAVAAAYGLPLAREARSRT